ncbi:MAG: LacI family DNA-binding transcriptional regulator [Flavobacteriaceae bacterium]
MFAGTTLKQISLKSGYSVSTVSKALNGSYEIKDSTKRKIKKIAKKNNYIPNRAAQSLRNKKTKVLAVIIPKITTAYFGAFVSEIQKRAFVLDYRILVLQSFEEKEKEKKCIRMVNDGSVDGIVLFSNNPFEETEYQINPVQNFMKIPYHSKNNFTLEATKELAYTSFLRLVS